MYQSNIIISVNTVCLFYYLNQRSMKQITCKYDILKYLNDARLKRLHISSFLYDRNFKVNLGSLFPESNKVNVNLRA